VSRKTEEARFFEACSRAIDELHPLLGEDWRQFEDLLRRLGLALAADDVASARLCMDRLLELGLAGRGQELMRRLLRQARGPEPGKKARPPSAGKEAPGTTRAPFEIPPGSVVIPPPALAEPRPAAPAGGERPEFQVKLKGDQVHGASVMARAEVDLVVFLGPRDRDALALKGERLDQALAGGGELGVFIVPVGYRLRGDDCYQRATIRSAAMDRELVFRLEAAAAENPDAGVWMYLDLNGSPAYAFFLSIPVIEDPSEAVDRGAARPPINLDAKGVPIDARLCITQDAGALIVSYHNMASGFSRQRRLAKLTLSTLAATLRTVQGLVQEAATSQVWAKIPDPFRFSATDSQKRQLADLMRRVAQGGWELWVRLGQDKDLEPVLRDLDGLPPGSRIDIVTDSVFVPWEIVYPENVDAWESAADGTDHALKPMLFWGARYIMQSTLPEETDIAAEKLAHSAVVPAAAVCVNPSIDDDFEEAGRRPSESHRSWAKELRDGTGLAIEPVEPQTARRMLLQGRRVSKWIYIFCHGRGGEAEAIELGGGEAFAVRPTDLHGTASFEGWPIVFLNSCSSGAYAPLSLTNFYQQFREPKKVLGLIGTTFPVPAMTAAAIGQRVTQEYLQGRADIGSILHRARRELVENSVPIGLFYALHCPADARAIPAPRDTQPEKGAPGP
jgi:hypothetical protein